MINAPHDKEFVFHDGTRARNILDLVSKLEGISDHDFHHFVNHHKNDFANWLEHVFFDKALAEKLRKANSRSETIQILKDRVNDVTIGHSVIQLTKLEDHHKDPAKKDHGEAKDAKEDKDKKNPDHMGELSDHHKAIEHEKIQKDQNGKFGHNARAGSDHDLRTEEKAKRNWFRLFKRKDLSEDKLKRIESEEEDKLFAERSLKDETSAKERENALWITLYFALVLLIITLLVYKLFL